MNKASALVVAAVAIAGEANDHTVYNSSFKVIAVTLYRELQTDDVRDDHKLMLAIIRNRAAERHISAALVCLERWQFSYWNRFWADGKSTLTPSKLSKEYAKVPDSFVEGLMSVIFKPSTFAGSETINHFYSPASMRPKYSEPLWARGKVPVIETKRCKYYAL